MNGGSEKAQVRGTGWGETMAGIPKPAGKKLEFLTEKGFSQEGYSWRRDSTGLRGFSARIPAGVGPGAPLAASGPQQPPAPSQLCGRSGEGKWGTPGLSSPPWCWRPWAGWTVPGKMP